MHAVGSCADAIAVGPSGSWESGGSGRMYLLPWGTEERPVPADRVLEVLGVVGRSQACVMIDGGRGNGFFCEVVSFFGNNLR